MKQASATSFIGKQRPLRPASAIGAGVNQRSEKAMPSKGPDRKTSSVQPIHHYLRKHSRQKKLHAWHAPPVNNGWWDEDESVRLASVNRLLCGGSGITCWHDRGRADSEREERYTESFSEAAAQREPDGGVGGSETREAGVVVHNGQQGKRSDEQGQGKRDDSQGFGQAKDRRNGEGRAGADRECEIHPDFFAANYNGVKVQPENAQLILDKIFDIIRGPPAIQGQSKTASHLLIDAVCFN